MEAIRLHDAGRLHTKRSASSPTGRANCGDDAAGKKAAGRRRAEFYYRVAKRRKAVEKPRKSLENMEANLGRKIALKPMCNNSLKRH